MFILSLHYAKNTLWWYIRKRSQVEYRFNIFVPLVRIDYSANLFFHASSAYTSIQVKYCTGRYLSVNPVDQLRRQLGVKFYFKTSSTVKWLHRVFSRSDILLAELLNNIIFSQWDVSSTEDATKTCQLDTGYVIFYLVRSWCISQENKLALNLQSNLWWFSFVT